MQLYDGQKIDALFEEMRKANTIIFESKDKALVEEAVARYKKLLKELDEVMNNVHSIVEEWTW